MDGLTQLLRIISVTEVTKRWHVSESRLHEIINRYRLPVYFVKETRIRPSDGKTVYFCAEADYGCGDYFNTDNVEMHESEHQELLWGKAPEEEPEYIRIEDVRKMLGMSPQRFVDFLNDASGSGPWLITSYEENFRNFIERNGYRGSSAVPYFTVSMLDSEDLTVHRLDWQEFHGRTKATPPSEDIPFPSVAVAASKIESQLAEVKRQLVEKDTRIAALGSELAAARQQIAELTAELNSAKVEPATTVNAAMWKDSVSAAFGVWAEIVQGDKTDWKEEEFRAALVTRCADYLTDVHAIAWRILPGTFKHGRGRPKKNPGNIQQSDNT